jgi:hypothetical protein
MASNSVSERPTFVPGWLRGISLSCTLLWFVMRDFFRSPWLFLNALAIVFAQLFLLNSEPTRARYFGIVYLLMLALAAMNTMALFSRANGSHTYPILARPMTRTTYVAATILAAWVVSLLSYLVMTLLVYLRYGPPLNDPGPEWLGLTTYLAASIAVVVGITFAVSLMSLLSAFVTPFWLRLFFLAVIALFVMSFDPRTFPLPFLSPVVEHIPPVLAPVAGALRFATDATPDALARASVIILTAYSSTILAMVLWLSTRREIILD